MQVARGIHHFDTGPFNWYVIEEAGRLTLVDAGFPGHYAAFVKGIASLGRGMRDVEAIVVTHAHADHTGFAERVRLESGAPVFVHEADRDSIGHVLQLPWWGLLSNAWRPYTAGMLGRAIAHGVFTMPTITQARTFRDGDVLDVPGRPHVIHTPGHTDGEVALHMPEPEVLISGDTLVTRDLMSGEAGPPQITHHLLNADDRAALRSLDRIRDLGRVTMLPGHGRPWTGDMAEAVSGAEAIARRRPERLRLAHAG
ncbi:MAG: MBL fold metallo-hydrolase [Candidatus Eisenbacteria bacterium]